MLANYIKHLIETAARIPGMKFTREKDREPFDWDMFLAEHGMERLPNGRVVPIGRGNAGK